MDPFIQKICERRVGGRYQLIEHIGEGGHGAVYRAKDVVDDREVVLKLEHHSTPFCSISQEVDAYNEVAGNTGFAEIYWLGQQDDFDVLAFELLGPSLTDLFLYCGGTFSLKTVLLIMDQLLERFRVIHEHEIVHRDVKPSNCLLGAGEKSNTLFVTDFGLSLLTSRGDGDDPEEQINGTPRAIGTAYFVISPIVLHRIRHCWQRSCHWSEIYQHGPKAPDHAQLQHVLCRLSRREGIEYDDVFDWTPKRNGNKPAGPPCPASSPNAAGAAPTAAPTATTSHNTTAATDATK
ncbi:hypothetical protein KVT40_007087 [Elsinoe batatas]|uniref:non-specific serine/threonine protein kinase n=1 Tax=Elsinoe batatas TaxID=2601811 RepID=A0A8K0PD63_9PEZI|nr:hypothetical protein KVT40_007087 [Elsinoe batatas]